MEERTVVDSQASPSLPRRRGSHLKSAFRVTVAKPLPPPRRQRLKRTRARVRLSVATISSPSAALLPMREKLPRPPRAAVHLFAVISA
ncbi:hypothetical protein SKAU_G00147330 [Synaphobranchus kaupii]|uniref:Uncharacterized protein n=1 Tax=Synaphobranchus kaupii TaxID=118154 RepID=A0A9Q1FTI5_SYNKA|nr:hypothetical protein SKAU_G00147330 [Synaphobranchus kaupii]